MIALVGAILSKRAEARRRSGPGRKAAPGGGAVTNAQFLPFVGAFPEPETLLEYACTSPLLPSCGLSREKVQAEFGVWELLGARVAQNLQLPPPQQLEPFQKARIYQYYLPVFFWCQRQLAAHRAGGTPGPLVLGISAPQGCGKTTLCEQLEDLLGFTGSTAAAVSIDDFYLTNADQRALAAAHPGNPLLELRGNAGSHDMALGSNTLRALRAATSAEAEVALPRYDKSAFQGRGDRAPREAWPTVRGPLDVVLLEGWMQGFRPCSDAAAAAVDPNLVPVNQFLRGYEAAWDSFVDSWLVVRVAQPEYAYQWRLQAELAMRAAGKPAMTDDEVRQFVERFMPAYRCYLPGLYTLGPTTARPGRLLVVEVNDKREPVQQQPERIM